jgi:hypothetical protein
LRKPSGGRPAAARASLRRVTTPAKMGVLALVPSMGTNSPPRAHIRSAKQASGESRTSTTRKKKQLRVL